MFSQLKDRYDALMNEDSPAAGLLNTLSEKTGIDKRLLAPGILAFLGLYLVFGYGASLISNLIGFTYPAYLSVKAIESDKKEDDTQWLTYWVVYGVFSIVETFSDIFLSWFPFYYVAKCVFLIWCMAPVSWNGSAFVYSRVVRPFYLKHQSTMDNVVTDLSGKAKGMAESVTKEAVSMALNQDKEK